MGRRFLLVPAPRRAQMRRRQPPLPRALSLQRGTTCAQPPYLHTSMLDRPTRLEGSVGACSLTYIGNCENLRNGLQPTRLTPGAHPASHPTPLSTAADHPAPEPHGEATACPFAARRSRG